MVGVARAEMRMSGRPLAPSCRGAIPSREERSCMPATTAAPIAFGKVW